MYRIHVVGIAGRTGTTLLVEALRACFAIDAWEPHETSLFTDRKNARIYLTKRPGDLDIVAPRLLLDPRLYVICMVRDPRDIVASKHGTTDSHRYAEDTERVSRRVRLVTRLESHARFSTVRYEDLVTEPSTVQRYLERRLPFLERTADFRDFHLVAGDVSASAQADLNGVRPISPASVGKWRANLPRIVDQRAGLTEALIELGYERDGAWEQALDGVLPVPQPPAPEHPGFKALWIPPLVRRPLRRGWHRVRPWLEGLRGATQYALRRPIG